MRLKLTMMAVHQFMKRFAPEATFEEAKKQLEALLPSAERTGNSLRGDPYYTISDPPCRLIVKTDSLSEGYLTVVTVIGPDPREVRLAKTLEESEAALAEMKTREKQVHKELRDAKSEGKRLDAVQVTSQKKEERSIAHAQRLTLVQQEEVLKLELEILREEARIVSEQERSLRMWINNDHTARVAKAREAAIVLIKALFGVISREDALAQVRRLDRALVGIVGAQLGGSKKEGEDGNE